MTLRVFFSFDHEHDSRRAERIKTCWESKGGLTAGFLEPSRLKALKRKGEKSMHKWVDAQVRYGDVTAVLIGWRTSQQTAVRHAIERSHQLEKGLLGIFVHNIKDYFGKIDPEGPNPFDTFFIRIEGAKTYLSQLYPVYRWIEDAGHFHLADWIRRAADRPASTGADAWHRFGGGNLR